MPQLGDKTNDQSSTHTSHAASSSSADVGKRPLVPSEPVAPTQAPAQSASSTGASSSKPKTNEPPKRVPIEHGLIHGSHDLETNSIDLHVDAKADGGGLTAIDMLAVAKHCRLQLMQREEDGGPPGTFMLRPQGAAITKIVVEMLGESIGSAWSKTMARGAKTLRKNGVAMGNGEPRSDNKLHSSVHKEHFSYIDSLVGQPGVAMQPITMGEYGAKSAEEFEANMLDKSALGKQRLAQYKGQLADPNEEMGPSMMITLSSQQLPRVISVLQSQI